MSTWAGEPPPEGERAAPAAAPADSRSIPALVRELIEDVRRLLVAEARLARAETRETLSTLAGAATRVAVGAACGVAALLAFAVALNHVLTVLLAQAVGVGLAIWLAPLLLAIAFGALAAALVVGGLRRIRRESLVPEQTLETLEEHRAWLRDKTRH